MKKKIDTKTEKSNTRWTHEEIEFIRQYYGRVKTDSIALALNRSAIAVWQQCKIQGFKLGERIYQTEQLIVTFNGQQHKLQCFQYSRNEKGNVVDKTVVRKKIGRPRKYKLNLETKTSEAMSAHRRKPDLKPKRMNPKVQEKELQEFEIPQGKKLVQIDKKTWVYR
jgi:hypothetical protein